MNLKPQDIVILLKLISIGDEYWTYSSLSLSLKISPGEINSGVKRATTARLFNKGLKKPIKKSLEEFIIHGIKYSFPPTRGGQTRGIVTGYAAPPLNELISMGNDPPPVWPYPNGNDLGYEFSPLYKTVPEASLKDRKLYELLTLIDVIRDGRARESEIAIREIRNRLTHNEI
jgi:hypothetical protein